MDAFATIVPALRRTLLVWCLLLAFLSQAQERNPFDLTPRLGLPPAAEAPAALADTGNPFDLIAPSAVAPASAPSLSPGPAAPRAAAAPRQAVLERLFLVSLMSSLLLFTILLTLLRSFFRQAYQAFINDNLLTQLHRKTEGRGALPYYLFYCWALLNIGFFFFLLLNHYQVSTGLTAWLDLAACIGLAAGLFLSKQLIIAVLGAIFPIQKETRLYNFTIIIFTIMLGVLLLVLNMFIAYMPAAYTQGFVYAAFAAIALLYLFRALRGLIIGQQFVYAYLFHFLLYLCAVEIAPVVVLARLINDAAGT